MGFFLEISNEFIVGPPESMKIPPDQIIEEMKQAGYQFKLQDDADTPNHFTQIFVKN